LKVRRNDAAALGQVDKIDLKREEVRGNERGGRTEWEPKPSRLPASAPAQGRTPALR
jgi:hypothetical protein